jgi:DNA-binding response OmpR family regulator
MLSMMTEDQKAHMGLAEEEDWTLRTILLVEPDDSLRGALLPALRAAGYQVVMFPTGEAALQAIAERQGQLLILDKHCGEPHWTEVLMLVQVDAWSRENVPVGVFVDAGNRRDLLLAWQGGAAFCLTRPFDSADVVDLTNRLQRLWPEELRPR